jgi:hypothetical protein
MQGTGCEPATSWLPQPRHQVNSVPECGEFGKKGAAWPRNVCTFTVWSASMRYSGPTGAGARPGCRMAATQGEVPHLTGGLMRRPTDDKPTDRWPLVVASLLLLLMLLAGCATRTRPSAREARPHRLPANQAQPPSPRLTPGAPAASTTSPPVPTRPRTASRSSLRPHNLDGRDPTPLATAPARQPPHLLHRRPA